MAHLCAIAPKLDRLVFAGADLRVPGKTQVLPSTTKDERDTQEGQPPSAAALSGGGQTPFRTPIYWRAKPGKTFILPGFIIYRQKKLVNPFLRLPQEKGHWNLSPMAFSPVLP
jgi:hypothetical protein